MSAPIAKTTFASRGRINGVLRQRPAGGPAGRARGAVRTGAPQGVDDLDTEAFEAVYYRARLILGEALPRPARPSAGGR
jgi:hypothetical protein